MPKASLDQTTALHAIATVLQSRTNYSVDQLMNDHHLLEAEVRRLSFSWAAAAEIAGVTKSRLYHWFRETFTRKLRHQLTHDDIKRIKREVGSTLGRGEDPMLESIKSTLSQDYDTQVVKVAFQNAKMSFKQSVVPMLNLPSFHVEQDSKVNSARSIISTRYVDELIDVSDSEGPCFYSFLNE